MTIVFAFVPVFVQRPSFTGVAGRPQPLMPTARTSSACRKRVPRRPATVEERLRSPDGVTAPATRPDGTPAAARTANATERIIVFTFGVIDQQIGRTIVFHPQSHRYWGLDPVVHLSPPQRGRSRQRISGMASSISVDSPKPRASAKRLREVLTVGFGGLLMALTGSRPIRASTGRLGFPYIRSCPVPPRAVRNRRNHGFLHAPATVRPRETPAETPAPPSLSG